MDKKSVLIARFPYRGYELSECVDWLVETVIEMKGDARVGDIFRKRVADTPISMTRNQACDAARRLGADFVLMIDDDVAPDHHKGEPGARPFWASSFEFLLAHGGPAVVAAPYCGPPPHENVYVFRWRNRASGGPADSQALDLKLDQYTREEAAERTGIEEVAALPTGLLLMHTAVLEGLPPPWFDYEYETAYETHKATTEDVYFTRNLSMRGVPVYCNWDAWAGHDKRKLVGKPRPVTFDLVRDEYRRAWRQRLQAETPRLVDVPPGGVILGT
jgi:hypothetical protein